MPIQVCNEGERQLLDVVTADRTNWVIRLFQNNLTPGDGTTFSDFTEADFSGYSEIACPAFTTANTNTDGKAETTWNDFITFTHDGGATANSVYGYYVVQTAAGKLIWTERFSDAPRIMQVDGDRVSVHIVLTLSR